MSLKAQKAHGIVDLVDKIADVIEEQLNDCDKESDKEQYAFLFGQLALTAILSDALHTEKSCKRLHLMLNYTSAHQAYLEARQECDSKEESSEKEHQISMEELFPDLLKALDEYFEKKHNKKE
jgi:hypothetical protein